MTDYACQEKWLTSIEDSIDTSIQRLEDNIKKGKERLITVANNSTDNKDKQNNNN